MVRFASRCLCIDAISVDARGYAAAVKQPRRDLLTQAEAAVREARLKAAGIKVTTPTAATITLLAKRPITEPTEDDAS